MAIKTKLHQTTSETYGARNTPTTQTNDAQNPLEAIRRSVNSYRPALLKEGYSNDEIDKAIQTLSAPYVKK